MTHDLLPPLPKPYNVASTIRCTACERPYQPARPAAVGAAPWFASAPKFACECGSTEFKGTIGYDSPSPVKYTADQMRAYALQAAEQYRKDAERYRFVRDVPKDFAICKWNENGEWGGQWDVVLSEDSNATIDAAMHQAEDKP